MRTKISVLFLAALFAAFSADAFAQSGNSAGGGGGTGGGKGQTLALVSAKPADGETTAPVDGDIILVFNKNVVHVSVRDNNAARFELSFGGKKIPIEVKLADDQMQPELRETVVIHPKEKLLPAARYTLTIGAGLTAKSGSVLDRSITVSFATAP